ncbi:MAG: dihydrofolate reductase family protein [Bacteroidia bacterium]|jgi:dihydrofolate reductase|nr:dihydrofolate reductase family protein [Bacteroidia bacterium]
MLRQVVLYIACSLDGYIAKADGNIDFLNTAELPGEDYGYAAFLSGIDTVIWGRKTFEKVLSFGIALPHADKKLYVVSRTRSGTHEHAEFHADVVELVKKLKQEPGADIYCDGGAEVVAELLRHGLINRIAVSVIPYMLGGGIRLFAENIPEKRLQFKKSIAFPSGVVQLWYDLPQDNQSG